MSYDEDALQAALAQQELEERQQREDAAIARCRPLQDELRHMIETIKHRKPNHDQSQ